MTHLWLHWMPQFCLPFATEEMHQKNLSTGRKRSIRHTGHYVWWRGADLDTPVLVARKFHGLTDKVCANKGKAQISREIYAMSFSVLVGWSIEGFTLPWNQWLTYFKWSISIYTWTMINNYIHDSTNDKRGYMVCQIGHLFFLKGYCWFNCLSMLELWCLWFLGTLVQSNLWVIVSCK